MGNEGVGARGKEGENGGGEGGRTSLLRMRERKRNDLCVVMSRV